MAQCEMCGRDSELVDAIVEGTILSVCRNCAAHGDVVAVERKNPVIETSPSPLMAEPELEISDCANQVKEAREKKGLTQKQLAQAIAEKESVIHKIESGKSKPSLKTAAKLEQFLNIKLIESVDAKGTEGAEVKQLNLRDPELTIGDLMSMKKAIKK